MKKVCFFQCFLKTNKHSERIFKMTEITNESLIGDVLDLDSGTSQFFLEMGMHCLGCPSSRGESIEEACMVHGTDCEELVEKINEYLASK
jgi:hybrid cluster-associated redox disulfide protein